MNSSPRYPQTILATCPLPWTDTGDLDEDLFARTVRTAVAEISQRLYIFGTAGEGYAVTDSQFSRVTRRFAHEMLSLGAHPMVGLISLSLGTIRERLAFAHALGVREFQLSLPSWGALLDREVDVFFDETCGRFSDCRFLHYNLARAQRVLTGADYARLCARHENLVAVKMGGEPRDALTDVARHAPALRCFFTEFAFLHLRDATECGLLSALTACAPRAAHRVFQHREPERPALEATLRQLHATLKSAVAPTAHMDGAYDKAFVKLNFPEFPLRLLPPYACMAEDAYAEFARAARPLVAALAH